MTNKYQLKPEIIPMLLKLSEPISKQELISELINETGEEAQQISNYFSHLDSAGILKQVDFDAQPSSYAYGYGRGVIYHQPMLQDFSRTDGFRRALKELIRQGDTVIDVGAGSGILGFFAAEFGAKRVVLIENTSVIEDAKLLAKANGLESKVEFYHGDAKQFDWDIKANVIVSEWIGFFLMEEYMYSAFSSVRDRCLIKNGSVIPCRARLYMAPIDDSHLYFDSGLGFWEAPVYGLDFSCGFSKQMEKPQKIITEVKEESIIAEPWELMKLDCLKDNMNVFHFESSGEFKIDRAGSVHGLAGWFELDLSPHVLLDTSPFAKRTHWYQTYFPVARFNAEKGDILKLVVKTQSGGGGPDIIIKAKLFRGAKEIHSLEHTYSGSRY